MSRSRPRSPGPSRDSGSVLLPVVAAMLILLLTGVALSEMYSAQTMSSAHLVDSVRARWAAEGGCWHAALLGSSVDSPVTFAGVEYTVSKSDTTYTATATRNDARSIRTLSLGSGVGDADDGEPQVVSDLAGHWKFDETNGNVATDGSGLSDGKYQHGVKLKATGAPSGNLAPDFDGKNDYVEIPHVDAYLIDDGTIQFWFYAEDTRGHQALFSKDSSDYDNGGHVHIYLNGDDLTVRLQSTSKSYEVKKSNVVDHDEWYHVAFTFGSAGMNLYVNGASVDTDAYTGGLGTSSGGSGNTEPITVGIGSWGSDDGQATPTSYPFEGRIDSLAIYNKALSAAEVLALYTAGGAL